MRSKHHPHLGRIVIASLMGCLCLSGVALGQAKAGGGKAPEAFRKAAGLPASASEVLFTEGPHEHAGRKYYWLAEWKIEVTLPDNVAPGNRFAANAFNSVGPYIRQHDIRTGSREAKCAGAPDAPPRARDNSRFSLQFQKVHQILSSLFKPLTQ